LRNPSEEERSARELRKGTSLFSQREKSVEGGKRPLRGLYEEGTNFYLRED